MNGIEYVCDEVFRQTVFLSLCNYLGQNGIPPRSLQDGDVVVLLVFSYLAAYLHARTEGIKNILVYDINLRTELVDIFLPLLGIRIGISHFDLLVKEIAEFCRSKLLLRITQGYRRIAM